MLRDDDDTTSAVTFGDSRRSAPHRPPGCRVDTFPDLQTAGTHAAYPDDFVPTHVVLPVERRDRNLFAVRAAAASRSADVPLSDGDWAVFEASRHLPLSALYGRVVLVELPTERLAARYQLRRVQFGAHQWELASMRAEVPLVEITEQTAVVGRLVQTIAPDSLAPPPGSIIPATELSRAFGLDAVEPQTGRHDGHLFLFLAGAGAPVVPDRLLKTVDIRYPGETGFVLVPHADGNYLYVGVARWRDDEARWAIPRVDRQTGFRGGEEPRSDAGHSQGARVAPASFITGAKTRSPRDESRCRPCSTGSSSPRSRAPASRPPRGPRGGRRPPS